MQEETSVEKQKNCQCDDCKCDEAEATPQTSPQSQKCECADKECQCSENKREVNGQSEEKQKKDKKWHKNKHEDKLNEAYNKISELEDKLIRQNAEVINYRKRREEEFSRMMKFCNEDIIKDLLPVLDNFERAMKLSEDNNDETFVKLNEGYKMVYCGLENIMQKFEVKAIDGANKPFDPVYHNAVIMEAKEGVEPGTVIEVLQKGYLYKDKVIRPAMVKVSE